jgi:hypothetical protein
MQIFFLESNLSWFKERKKEGKKEKSLKIV